MTPPRVPAPDQQDRTYDRAETELILRSAAESDSAVQPALPYSERDGLSLAELQNIGAEVGISRAAIAAATLRVALAAAHESDQRWHLAHTVSGTIRGESWAQLADDLRAATHPIDVRHSDNGVDFGIHERDGELGQLRVSIRSANGNTTINVWSTAPHLGPLQIAACGALGIPAAVFPVVASAGGHWPVLGSVAAIAGVGFGVGTAVTLVWQRWATTRWRARLASLITAIVERTTARAGD